MEEVSIWDLKLCWAANPFHTKISYQRLNGMNVDTADKLVITRVSTFSPSLLRTLIWYEKYEKYEITQACQMPVFQPGSSSLSSVCFLLARKYTMPTPSPLPMMSTTKSETVEWRPSTNDWCHSSLTPNRTATAKAMIQVEVGSIRRKEYDNARANKTPNTVNSTRWKTLSIGPQSIASISVSGGWDNEER